MTTGQHHVRIADVGTFYDFMGTFFSIVWGESIHVGYWADARDTSSMAQAQDQFTDLLIRKTPVGHGQRVLDIGCGTGKPAIRLAHVTGCDVVGITVSRTQVARATERAAQADLHDHVTFQYANAMDLPFPSTTFDAAWAFESLFHMPDRAQVLQETYRVLRPGGHCVIADFSKEKRLLPHQKALLSTGFHVTTLTTIDQYCTLVGETGFDLVEVLDVRDQILPTMDRTRQALHEKRTELEAVYGKVAISLAHQLWPQIAKAFQEAIGYVVVVARKPHGAYPSRA